MVKTTTGSLKPATTQAKTIQNGQNDLGKTEVKRTGDMQRSQPRVTVPPVKNRLDAMIEPTTEGLFYEIDKDEGME